MKVGELVRFVDKHWEKSGTDYTKDWIGIILEKTVDWPEVPI